MSDSTTLVYKKKKKKFKIFPIVNAIFFIIVACLIMIPIYRVIISSIDANTSYNFVWIPSQFTWGGYTAVLTRSSLYTPFLISVVTTIIGTFVGLLVVTLGGYVLIQWEMPGRNFFAYMLLFTMIFDGGMIPKYLVIKQLGLMNTLWPIKNCVRSKAWVFPIIRSVSPRLNIHSLPIRKLMGSPRISN